MPTKDHFNPRRIVSVLIIFAIGFIFAVQWGPASRGCESPLTAQDTAIARVNGKEIPIQEFRQAYRQQLDMYRARGAQLPQSMLRQFLPSQIVEALIEFELWSQAANDRAITASDEELRRLIRQNPDFQRDGRFSVERYREVLRDFYRLTPTAYEDRLRRELAARKMRSVVASGAVVSDDEVRAQYLQRNNEAEVTFARFLPAMFVDQVKDPTPEEIAAFQAQNAQAITDYYEANRSQYQQEEKVSARHILVRSDRGAPAEQREAARKRIEEIRKEIVEGGRDFAQAAQEHSEDPGSKVKGGALGTQPRTAWVKEFSDTAFSLEPGKVSEPVETQFGYHLIRVDARQEATRKEQAEVAPEIASILLKRERAKEYARAQAEKALAALKAGQSLAQQFPPEGDRPAAKKFETEKRPEAVDTGKFNATAESIPYLPGAPEALTAVFATQQPQPLDPLFPTGEGFAVVQVTARSLPAEDAFAQQKEKLISDARTAKAAELEQSFITALRRKAEVVKNDEVLSSILDAT